MDQEKISYRVDRDFGQTFNTSLRFVRQNFKLFAQSIVLIAGPFIFISAIAASYYNATVVLDSEEVRAGIYNGSEKYGIAYFVYLLTAIISNLSIIGTTYSFMIVYYEKGPNNFTLSDVGRTLTKNIGHLFGAFFTLLLYLILAGVVLGGLGFIFASVSTGLGILYAFLIIIGLGLFGPPVMWVVYSVYLIKMHEGGNAFFAYGRARDVMKNNFWWTWVLFVCGSLAVGLASFVFMVPEVVYQLILTLGSNTSYGDDVGLSLPFIAVSTIATFFSTVLSSVLFVICGFHYYSLAEKKDGKGILERINEIGNKQLNNVEQQY